ncbi:MULTISPECIES: MBL fold metallo-hydrolase [unclassified Leptolyngbya]|uniref:MBL fold metallo-hydrolase n=1 Tax=unclassified Leptolyngbya TaxID=2650499 RepID=UPI0016875F65|nr:MULTISPECIES: MBL fold metallo-hydrolase [unclassified Leptolyngbya]MBD1910487.1 MBL fold metallo-hydrolase [Leptolyngbya sp. FACHB-8]MBD2153654.1 MBL fold metallo-hydrolase [Leptolyngbya sp. FACHB-16]
MKQFRRWIVGLAITLATVLGVVSLQPQTSAQSPEVTLESAGVTVQQVANGVYSLIASTDFPPTDPANIAICNATIVIGSDGVLVIDPFQNEALANLVFSTVATLTDQPIRYVVNTHYHFDHSGGNAAADERGFPIVGRGPIREFMLTRNRETDPNVTPPDIVVNGQEELWLGDRQVRLAEFEGHSSGTDMVAYIPDADVLVAGDLLFSKRIPYVGDGNIRVWRDNLTQLIAAYGTAKVVPGHGPVGDRATLEELKTYLTDLETLALSWREAGLSQEEALAQATVPTRYAEYLFQAMYPNNLEVAYKQITLGQDDAASIQQYFAAQPRELKDL